MPTFLKYWTRAQNWVDDIRQKKGSWAKSVVSRLQELGLDKKRIGVMVSRGQWIRMGGFPYSVYKDILELMPEAILVNLDDTMERIRMIKSSEEIGI